MKRILILLFICTLLCGCAAAGPGPQLAAPTDGTQQTTVDTLPSGTVTKNPGFTLDPNEQVDEVPEITENRIRKDYCDTHANVTMEQVRLRIMGAFEETYVLFVDVRDMMYADVITEENVGGFRFVYSNSHRMQVWHDGQFYSLPEAYAAGFLTRENLQKLSQDYYRSYPYLAPEYSK